MAPPVPEKPPRSLYDIKRLNKPEISIITIEDPIEFALEGTTQIQTNIDVGLTFGRTSVHPAPGPEHHHGGRNSRRRNRIDIGECRAHRTSCPFNPSHERFRDDIPATPRYGRTAVPRRIHGEPRDQPATGTKTMPKMQSGAQV